MKFEKTLIAIIVILMLTPVALAVSMDTAVQGAAMEGYGESDSMSIEYDEGEGKGWARITLKKDPGVSHVDVRIGTYVVPMPVTKPLQVCLENPLTAGTYPVLVLVGGNKIAECSLTVGTYYDVTVTSGTGGTASADHKKAMQGTVVTLTATPSSGYIFKEWQASGVTFTGNTFVMPANDVAINAIFEASGPTPTAYTVTVRTEGDGTASASPSSADAGMRVTLTANPSPGNIFKEWKSSDVSISGNEFTMPAKNVTVTAVFEAAYVPVTGVTISDTELALKVGDVRALVAKVTPPNASEQRVTWSSSDVNIISVSNGTVTAVGPGTATVTVTTTEGGFTATCVVSVSPPDYVVPASSGKVTKAQMDAAIASVEYYKAMGMVQDVRISETGDSVSVPADSVKTLLDLGSKLTMDLTKGSVSVTKDSIFGLEAGDELKVIVQTTVAPSGFILPADAAVVDVSMLLGERKVTSFGVPITVSIPYALSPGQDPSKLKVYYLSEGGTARDMKAVYDSTAGAMVFDTDHLSIYAVATSVVTPGGDGGEGTHAAVYVALAFVLLVVAFGFLVTVIKRR